MALSDKSTPDTVNVAASFAAMFRDAKYQPFFLTGNGNGAALLVHGFPGTPAEMRPLADALHADGWTTQGILLPGFGADIESLPRRKSGEWVNAVEKALIALQAEYSPVLLIGHSMGGALAIQVAAQHPPDGLILLSPFTEIQNPLWKALPVLKHAIPTFKPFRLMKLDFRDPATRKGISEFMPDVKLDDPAVQTAIRDFTVPTGMLDQIRITGENAAKSADRLTVPTLILQGSADTLVKPESTQALANKIMGAAYYPITGDHNLLDASQRGWRQVVDFCAVFADQVRRRDHAPKRG